MKINDIIKQKRKELGLTQEQVAEYLGVSTPAVNKWEKGSTYPDITLLPSLARLLKVDLNTLLCFNEDLTQQEIGNYTNELVKIIEEQGYETGFNNAMSKIQEYPNCDSLICMVALTLEGAMIMFGVEDAKHYGQQIEKLYERVAISEDIQIRNQAISMLISKYMEREDFSKAQELIDTLPNETIDKKHIESNLFVKQGKLTEAAEIMERKLLASAGEMQSTILALMEIAIKQERLADAQHLANVSEKTARLYDLWSYNFYVADFQLAVSQKDEDKCIELLKQLLLSMQEGWNLKKSPLYQHVKQKEDDQSFLEHMKSGIISSIQADKELEFLKNNESFFELIKKYSN